MLLLTLQHKYDCHIANMSHTVIMPYGYIDPKYLPICTTIQATATGSSHIIAKYIPETNMPLRCHTYSTYANNFMCTYETTMSVCIPHMNSLQSVM